MQRRDIYPLSNLEFLAMFWSLRHRLTVFTANHWEVFKVGKLSASSAYIHSRPEFLIIPFLNCRLHDPNGWLPLSFHCLRLPFSAGLLVSIHDSGQFDFFGLDLRFQGWRDSAYVNNLHVSYCF